MTVVSESYLTCLSALVWRHYLHWHRGTAVDEEECRRGPGAAERGEGGGRCRHLGRGLGGVGREAGLWAEVMREPGESSGSEIEILFLLVLRKHRIRVPGLGILGEGDSQGEEKIENSAGTENCEYL